LMCCFTVITWSCVCRTW